MAKRKPMPRPAQADPRWEHIFQSLEEGVVAVDAEGLVVSINQAAEQLTGCSASSALGQHHSQVFQRNPWVSALVEEIGQGDQGGIRAEGEIVRPWGRPVRSRASASPIHDAHGHPTGAAVILQDLTLQSGFEEDLQRAQSLSNLGAVVAGLAHEIKNPLSGIRGAVQLLGTEVGGRAPAGEYVRLVLREVDRLTKLVEQLLQLGSRGRLQRSAVNVHQVVDHVLALVAEPAARDGVRLVRSFDPSLPPVSGNADSLIQVFLNLVQNAMHAVTSQPAERPRQVTLTTRIETSYHLAAPRGADEAPARGRFLRVDVEDTGPGIPEQLQPQLFAPFFTTKPKGTGLGLAISHRIVTDHGGTIRFESAPGRTLFRVILPAWERAA